MTSLDSNFNFLCGRPHGAGPPSSVHLSLTPPPPCGRHKWLAPYLVTLLLYIRQWFPNCEPRPPWEPWLSGFLPGEPRTIKIFSQFHLLYNFVSIHNFIFFIILFQFADVYILQSIL